MKKILIAMASSVLLLNGAVASSIVSQYTVYLPSNGYQFVAWQFQAKTIAQALPSSPDGTIVYYWNIGSQQWVANGHEFGTWNNPNYTFQPGEAFLIWHPGNAANITLTGSSPTGSFIDRTFYASTTYAIGYPYPLNADYPYLECCHDSLDQYRYTVGSYGYSASEGDQVYTWDVWTQQWKSVNSRLDPFDTNYEWWWSQEGDFVSPTIYLGQGFLLIPSAYNTWRAYSYGVTCH